MNKLEVQRFNRLYKKHQRLLKLQGKSKKTIDSYSRVLRRIRDQFDVCPDKLSTEQIQIYFERLIESHSWSTVKIDRNGLQFFWKHVLKKDWEWLNIIKPPQIKSLPDILTVSEVEKIIAATRKLRYRVYLLTTYSMGLRLNEALSLQVGDIDAERKQVHIHRGKGCKDRMVPLPDFTLKALRELWSRHRNPLLLFPKLAGLPETIQQAKTHMHRGGAQQAMKAVVEECGIKKKFLSTLFATVLPHIC